MFIDGDVPVAPYPDWSQSDTALASIARLLRGLHDAARGFDPRRSHLERRAGRPGGRDARVPQRRGASNVVFRDGIAVALLDFEFAAPGRPVYDLAQLARLCVPIDDDFDQARLGWRPADRPARLRLVADAYGLDRDGRAELLAAMDDAIDRIEAAVRRSVDAGDPSAVALWNRTGGSERFDRRRRWWTDHHDQFAAALLDARPPKCEKFPLGNADRDEMFRNPPALPGPVVRGRAGGVALEPAVWEARHRWILGLLWFHLIPVGVMSLASGFGPLHTLTELFPLAGLAFLASQHG